MAFFDSVDGMYRSLLQQCLNLSEGKEGKEEMEASIVESLLRDHRDDLILDGLERGLTLTPQIKDMILKSGNLRLYQYLHSQKKLHLKSPMTFHFAIKTGNIETVIWLINDRGELKEWMMQIAIDEQQWGIVGWMLNRLYGSYVWA